MCITVFDPVSPSGGSNRKSIVQRKKSRRFPVVNFGCKFTRLKSLDDNFKVMKGDDGRKNLLMLSLQAKSSRASFWDTFQDFSPYFGRIYSSTFPPRKENPNDGPVDLHGMRMQQSSMKNN